jgi:hypothetical protein
VNLRSEALSVLGNDAGHSLLVAMLDSESSDVGSIPTPAIYCTEVIRLDEDAVPKTAGELYSLVSSSLTASA